MDPSAPSTPPVGRTEDGAAETRGPSEVVLALVLPFLVDDELVCDCWRSAFCEDAVWRPLDTVELVCKRWRSAARGDDVWRPICDRKLEWFEMVHRNKINNYRFGIVELWESAAHQILATQMQKVPASGRSLREVFVLSQRMGRLLDHHKYAGPDSQASLRGYDRHDYRTLRELSLDHYQYIVAPTIDRLRQLFDDPGKNGRMHEINAMRERLLNHARGPSASTMPRDKLTYFSKTEEAAMKLGQYFMAASASNKLDEEIFERLKIGATVGAVVEGLERITGEEISTQLSVQIKRTKDGLEKEFKFQPSSKKRRDCVSELDWPMNPVDILCMLIRQFWPKLDAEEGGDSQDETIQKWWLGLADPVCKFLIIFYRELRERFDDADADPDVVPRVPIDIDPKEFPLNAIKVMLRLSYFSSRGEIAEMFWRELDSNMLESIFKVYTQDAQQFCALLQQEYQSVYNSNLDLGCNAQILLDIFLGVMPSMHTKGPEMTSDYCGLFVGQMERTMDSWNELVGLVWTDEQTLWDPNTIVRLKSFERKFGRDFGLGRDTADFVPPEFHTYRMLKRFLNQKLPTGTHQYMGYYSLRKKVEKLASDARRIHERGGNIYEHSRKYEVQVECCDAVSKYRTFSPYIHSREHAMLALIPLLPYLSETDSKRLVYAVFIERKRELGSHERGFSLINFGGFECDEIPCSKNNDSDITEMMTWVISRRFSNGKHGIVNRLFEIPLPPNIISAMCSFLLENLYQRDLNDLDSDKKENAFSVLRHMKRFCYENPRHSKIVWDCLEQAIQKTISAVDGLDVEDIDEGKREIFRSVSRTLMVCCIDTRAKDVIPVLRQMYEGTQFALQPPDFITLEILIERINKAPRILVDTRFYHDLFHDEQI